MAIEPGLNPTNFIYALKDHHRWISEWFVIGFEVMRSPSNPDYDFDICSHLQGKYPKGFFFPGGWHPKCTCIAVPILVPEKLYNQMVDYQIGLNKKAPFIRYYKSIPKNALSYVRRNQSKCMDLFWVEWNRKHFNL